MLHVRSQWENTENKTSVVLYAVGALVVVWLTSTIVGAVNNVPLVGFSPLMFPSSNAAAAPVSWDHAAGLACCDGSSTV